MYHVDYQCREGLAWMAYADTADVRIPLVLRSDRPHRSARQPLASGSHCLPFKLRCKIPQTNHTSSRLHSLPPLPFYISFSIHFPVHPVQQHPVYPLLTNTACSLAPIMIS